MPANTRSAVCPGRPGEISPARSRLCDINAIEGKHDGAVESYANILLYTCAPVPAAADRSHVGGGSNARSTAICLIGGVAFRERGGGAYT